MTYQQVIKELESLKNERGINYYRKTFGESDHYLGLGLTPLRKLAKKIKINPSLAEELLRSNYFEAKMLSFMTDDPKQYDKNKLEETVKRLPEKYSNSPLSYFTMIFTEYIVSKSPDVKEVIENWAKSKNAVSRFMAYSALANLGRLKNTEIDFFEKFLLNIEINIQNEHNNVKDATNNCLLYWGQINKDINSKILKSLRKIGKIVVDYGDTSCKTPDVPAILSSDRIQNN